MTEPKAPKNADITRRRAELVARLKADWPPIQAERDRKLRLGKARPRNQREYAIFCKDLLKRPGEDERQPNQQRQRAPCQTATRGTRGSRTGAGTLGKVLGSTGHTSISTNSGTWPPGSVRCCELAAARWHDVAGVGTERAGHDRPGCRGGGWLRAEHDLPAGAWVGAAEAVDVGGDRRGAVAGRPGRTRGCALRGRRAVVASGRGGGCPGSASPVASGAAAPLPVGDKRAEVGERGGGRLRRRLGDIDLSYVNAGCYPWSTPEQVERAAAALARCEVCTGSRRGCRLRPGGFGRLLPDGPAQETNRASKTPPPAAGRAARWCISKRSRTNGPSG